MGTDIHIVAEVFRDGAWHLADVDVPDGRNYWAFAVLAGVRNGYGFAGADRGDPLIPISEPRGLPEDLSLELRAPPEDEAVDIPWLGDHSFSWVTLEELLAYDLETPVTLHGRVTPEDAQRWKEECIPPSMSVGLFGEEGLVRLEWQEPVRNCAPLIPQLIEAIRPLGEPKNVRLVFGFDS
jgi:hypothetical protein